MTLPNGKNEKYWKIRRPHLIPLRKGMVIVPTTTS